MRAKAWQFARWDPVEQLDAETLKSDVEWLEKKEKAEGYAISLIIDTINKTQRQHIKNITDP